MAKSRHSHDYKARFKRDDWKKLRRLVLIRDNFQCQRCGFQSDESGYFLQTHHYHYATFWCERLEDLVSLCVPCHKIADKERITQPHKRYKYEQRKTN